MNIALRQYELAQLELWEGGHNPYGRARIFGVAAKFMNPPQRHLGKVFPLVNHLPDLSPSRPLHPGTTEALFEQTLSILTGYVRFLLPCLP